MQASPSRLQRCDVTAEADGPKDSRMVSPPPKLIIGWSKEGGWVGLGCLGWVLNELVCDLCMTGLPQPCKE